MGSNPIGPTSSSCNCGHRRHGPVPGHPDPAWQTHIRAAAGQSRSLAVVPRHRPRRVDGRRLRAGHRTGHPLGGLHRAPRLHRGRPAVTPCRPPASRPTPARGSARSTSPGTSPAWGVPGPVPGVADPVRRGGGRAAPFRRQRRRGAGARPVRPGTGLGAYAAQRGAPGVRQLAAGRPVGPPWVMRRYFTEVLALIEGSGLFEVLAHLDFPRRYWPAGGGGVRRGARSRRSTGPCCGRWPGPAGCWRSTRPARSPRSGCSGGGARQAAAPCRSAVTRTCPGRSARASGTPRASRPPPGSGPAGTRWTSGGFSQAHLTRSLSRCRHLRGPQPQGGVADRQLDPLDPRSPVGSRPARSRCPAPWPAGWRRRGTPSRLFPAAGASWASAAGPGRPARRARPAARRRWPGHGSGTGASAGAAGARQVSADAASGHSPNSVPPIRRRHSRTSSMTPAGPATQHPGSAPRPL